jgi:hypothetical protein
MKMKALRQLFAIISLLAFLLTGQASAFGFVLCLGDDGHAALEYALDEACGEGPDERSGEPACGLSAIDEHCGPCLDLDPSLHAASVRPQDHLKFPPITMPAVMPASPVPVFVRVHIANLYPQPPPQISQAILFLRTVVLLN